jgi:DNA-binding transcriptional LysR family regulator
LGPLFHVLRLEQPDLRLQWQPLAFPTPERSRLERADVGLFVEPPQEPGLGALTIETSQILVIMAVGHRLAQHHELTVAEILDQPFPGGSNLDPEWLRFWTLDEHRGGPPTFTDHHVATAPQTLQVVASGCAIATIPATIANGLPHPGVVSVPRPTARRSQLASSGVKTTRIRSSTPWSISPRT